jgi:midasin
VPPDELKCILELRCKLAPSYAARLVDAMVDLQRRRTQSMVFAGRQGLITPRDLFRWANRGAVGYEELGMNGFLLLAERLRTKDERAAVQKV